MAEFERVDAWLAGLPPEEQERLLMSSDDGLPPLAAPGTAFPSGAAFRSESPQGRFASRGALRHGGMGLVELVYDRVLEREVALKRCRPRAPDESPASHALRLRLFRRKATVTARLEHPGIVPLHDVGTAAAGEPAYVMKRLLGTTLAARIPLPPAEAAVLLLRVADAGRAPRPQTRARLARRGWRSAAARLGPGRHLRQYPGRGRCARHPALARTRADRCGTGGSAHGRVGPGRPDPGDAHRERP